MPTCKRRNDCFSVLIYPDLSYFVTCNLLFCECPARPDYVNQVLIHQKNENQATVSYSPFRPCENTRRAGNVVWIISSQGTACCSLAFGLSFRQVTDLSSKSPCAKLHQSSYADPLQWLASEANLYKTILSISSKENGRIRQSPTPYDGSEVW